MYYKRFCGCIFEKRQNIFVRIVPCYKEGHNIGTSEVLNVNGIDTKKVKHLSPEDTARLMVANILGEEF